MSAWNDYRDHPWFREAGVTLRTLHELSESIERARVLVTQARREERRRHIACATATDPAFAGCEDLSEATPQAIAASEREHYMDQVGVLDEALGVLRDARRCAVEYLDANVFVLVDENDRMAGIELRGHFFERVSPAGPADYVTDEWLDGEVSS